MSELLLTRGVPASGKTTWAQFWLAQAKNRARVNRDDLRFELYGVYWGEEVDEDVVTKIQHSRVKALLEAGFDVVVDDTNLRAKTVKAWLKVAAEAGAKVRHEDFPIEVEEAIRRDYQRAYEGGRSVGEDVIRKFFRFMGKGGAFPEFPTLEEATAQFEPYVWQRGLPSCILVDLDGTLAHMTGRSPYDPTLYHTDAVDLVIAAIAEDYLGGYSADRRHVIIMTGRDAAYREDVEKWLTDLVMWEQGHDYDAMYMRPEGDTRNDAIVKNELFEQHIAGKYNVDFILDDRQRVVQMWRAKGLKVLQVADGDF